MKLPEEFAARVRAMEEPVTLVVNDGTRPSPAAVIRALEPFLPGKFRILFATGTHRPVTTAEKGRILGGFSRIPLDVQSNDCDSGAHVFLGRTSAGTPVDAHPWLLTGSALAVNTVEPHYFAGFTGGRKSFLPGCSSRRTIVANHFLACFPGAETGKLKGNPVHEDMAEGVRLLISRTECLMVNGAAGGEELFCGFPEETFAAAAEIAAGRFAVRVGGEYRSLELFPGPCLEVSLYQAMKAVYMWAGTVRPGGELVLNATCPEGLGAPQMERLLQASRHPAAVPASADEYLLGDHAVLRLSEIRKRVRLSFRTGIPMDRYGFGEPPAECPDKVREAGFLYPIMAGDDA